MTGIRLEMEALGLERLQRGIEQMRGLGRRRDFFEMVGAVVESQTHHRIQHEKTDAGGIPWAPWSDDYAKTRHSGHALLMNEGHLNQSVTFVAGDDAVVVGSNRIYAARQHESREFLGISAGNWDELAGAIDAFIEDTLQ